jgi:tRNA (mo5U34)-methyltransferase
MLAKVRMSLRPGTHSANNFDKSSFLDIPRINGLKGEELAILNSLLPWAAFILDSNGRSFGSAYSSTKRNVPQDVPDHRIIELDRRYQLSGKHVLEAGCFEGIHTVGLARHGATVAAFDGRIENVVKTLVRCWAFNVRADVFFWNLEEEKPESSNIECDILHHVGVLYHLMDPIKHLSAVLPSVRQALMLDTHIALEDGVVNAHSAGFDYRYTNFKEAGRKPPFAGLGDHAKWIVLDDLVRFLKQSGFTDVNIAEHRNERNGPRVLIYAHR